MKLCLSKSEVNSIISYVWQHSRGSPNGTAFKVWQKMFDFLNDDQQELDFVPKAEREIATTRGGRRGNDFNLWDRRRETSERRGG
jgi:hypothetical protein